MNRPLLSRFPRVDARSAVLSAVAVASIAILLAVVVNFLVPFLVRPPTSEFPSQVRRANLLEHYVGLLGIFLAFYMQFGFRFNVWFTPSQPPPWQAILTFFITGVVFTLHSMRLFHIPKAEAQGFSTIGTSILLVAVLLAATYLLAVTAPLGRQDPRGSADPRSTTSSGDDSQPDP